MINGGNDHSFSKSLSAFHDLALLPGQAVVMPCYDSNIFLYG